MTDVQQALDGLTAGAGVRREEEENESIISKEDSASLASLDRSDSSDAEDRLPTTAPMVQPLAASSNPRALLAAKAAQNAQKEARLEAQAAERRRREDEAVYVQSQGLDRDMPEGVLLSDESEDEEPEAAYQPEPTAVAPLQARSSTDPRSNTGDQDSSSAQKLDDQLRKWSAAAAPRSRAGTPTPLSTPLASTTLAPPSTTLAKTAAYDDEDPSLDTSTLDSSAASFSSPLLYSHSPSASVTAIEFATMPVELAVAPDPVPVESNAATPRASSSSMVGLPLVGGGLAVASAALLSHSVSSSAAPAPEASSTTPTAQYFPTLSPPTSAGNSNLKNSNSSSIPAYMTATFPSPPPTAAVIPASPDLSASRPVSQSGGLGASRSRQSTSQGSSLPSELEGLPLDPRDWDVENVMAWGKAVGFDELTLSKFQGECSFSHILS